MKCVVSAIALSACVACTDEAAPPSVTLDPATVCGDDVNGCVGGAATVGTVSGVPVVYERVKGDPVVAVEVLFRGGDRTGLSLWSEYYGLVMLELDGATDFTTVTWSAALDALGGSMTATGNVAYDHVDAYAPAVNWEPFWQLLARGFAAPSKPDYLLSHLEDETRHDYATELDDPARAASITAFSDAFGGTLLNRYRDDQEDARRVVGGDVDRAWSELQTKARLMVVVVGDVEWSDVSDEIVAAFGSRPEGREPPFASIPSKSASTAQVLSVPDAPNWQIVAYFAGPAAGDADYPALDVAMTLLDQRLFQEVRVARGLAYSVGASLAFGEPSLGSLRLATESPSQALSVVADVIRTLASTPAADGDLAAARGIVRSSLLAGARTSWGIASLLGRYAMVVGDPRGAQKFLRALDAVTPDDVERVLRQYLTNVSIAAAGPDGAVDERSLLAIVPGAIADGGAGPAPPDAAD